MKKSKGEITFRYINGLLLILLAFSCIFPFINVFAKSISGEGAILSGDILFFPKDMHLRAYEKVFNNASMFQSFKFTIFRTLLGTTLSVLVTMGAAYALSKKDLIGRNFFWMVIIITMFFNGGIIPRYLVVNQLHLLDTIWALIIPGLVSTYNLIIMKTAFQSIPTSLLESAKIDGCNDIVTLVKIVIPLSKATIATISLFYAVTHWNDFFQGLIYITTPEKFPLQLKLRQIVLEGEVELLSAEGANVLDFPTESLKAATIIYATLPILIVYPFAQRYFIKGVMLGSVKG